MKNRKDAMDKLQPITKQCRVPDFSAYFPEKANSPVPTASASHAALCAEAALLRDDLKRIRECIEDCVYENASGKLHASMALSRIAKAAREIKI